MEAVVGVVLVLLGAVGATVVARRLEEAGRASLVPVAVAPLGALIGAGAALLRGWGLAGSMVAGAVVVPLLGAIGRIVEVRRSRRR